MDGKKALLQQGAHGAAITAVGGGLAVGSFTGIFDGVEDTELVFVQFHFRFG